MADDDCKVDLSREDEYEGGVIPDGDVETCLKVLRTMRTHCVNSNHLGIVAIKFAEAHDWLYELVEFAISKEREVKATVQCERCKEEKECSFYGRPSDVDSDKPQNGEWLCPPCAEARAGELDHAIEEMERHLRE